MKKPKISLIDQKGHMGCHRGHQIGDTFDFDTERGNLCPMAMHVAFPYIDILRYGGKLPSQPDGSIDTKQAKQQFVPVYNRYPIAWDHGEP